MDILMGILIVWERLGWIVAGWLLAWLFATIWSHRMRWADELDADLVWVRLWCLIGAFAPIFEWRVLVAIPVLIWAHWDAEKRAEKEHIRKIKRAAHNKWWGETQYRWERQWERIPRQGH